MDADTHVEGVLSGELDNVFVARNAGSLKSLAGELLLLEGDEVDALGEGIDGGLLVTQIEDSDLGIGHTTAVARLDVRLVLTVSVAAGRSCWVSGPYERQGTKEKNDDKRHNRTKKKDEFCESKGTMTGLGTTEEHQTGVGFSV